MRWTAAAFWAMFAVFASAQFPYVRTLEVRSGQRRPSIDRIAQDGQGFIWAASDVGLLFTDGERVEVVIREGPEKVVALAPATKGMYAMLSNGILLRCQAWGCDTVDAGAAWRSSDVAAIIEDPNGAVWIGTYGGGLFRKAPLSGPVVRITGLPDDHVNDLQLLPDGRVVVATDQGLALCNGDRVELVIGEDQGVPDNLVLSIEVDANGGVWAGTDRSGVFHWKPDSGSGTIDHTEVGWAFGPVRSVRSTGEMVWIATSSAGVMIMDRSVANGTYRSDHGVNGAVPKDLIVDNDGVVWWCDGSERLHRADPNILVVPEHEGLDLEHITALCSDPTGRIWFATDAGLFNHVAFFSEERKVTRVAINVDPRTPIVSLAAASDGTVWAATFGNGVYAIDPTGKVLHFTDRDSPSLDNVLKVRAVSGVVWFATLQGIVKYENDRFVELAQEAGFVYDVFPKGKGVLIATDGKGVMRMDASWVLAAGMDRRTYYALIDDHGGRVWAAGPGTGFGRVDVDSVDHRFADLPPFDGNFYAVGSYFDKLIAFGSTGVLGFDPKTDRAMDLTAVFGLEGITAELGAICTDASGALWFACDNGLYRMRPNASHFRSVVPTVIISVRVGQDQVAFNERVHTSHDRNTLNVRFSGMYFTDPSAVRFEYRLVGLDDTPMRTRDRQVAFSALPPGFYTFQVRAFIGEDPGDAPWTSFELVIDPPWWRRSWAIVLGILIAGTIVLLLVRARDRRIGFRARMEQERTRFQLDALRSQVDPHFLFNSFNALVELIESDPEVAVEHVEQLSVFFRNILLVRDKERITVTEELRLLQNYFDLEVRRFGDAIRLNVNVIGEALERGIVPLTLQLLVENALKHNVITSDEVLNVDVHVETEHLVVTNSLRARRTPARSTGFGLDSIIKRYASLTTRPVLVEKTGTEFIVRIPLIEATP